MNRHLSAKLTGWLVILPLLAFLLVLIPSVRGQDTACGNAPAPRLVIGGRARITIAETATLRLREGPGLSSGMIDTLSGGGEADILAGPVCADGLLWWQIALADGRQGWAAEGSGSTYFLTPIRAAAPTPDPADSQCDSVLPLVGGIGDRLVVSTVGEPLEARLLPATASGLDSRWWAGHLLTIIDGPACGSGYWWWRVTLPNNRSGWVQVGDSLQYYIEVLLPTPTTTSTFTPSATFTATHTSTSTATPTVTPTLTASATLTPTATPSRTATQTPTATSTPSDTPTPRPTSTPRATLTPSPTVDTGCLTAPLPRLTTEDEGIVVGVDALRLRALPAVGAGEIGLLRDGAAFTVIDGPLCNSGYHWYRIRLPYGTTGWIAEGQGATYWVQPADYEPPPLAERACLAWGDEDGLHLLTNGQQTDLAAAVPLPAAGLAISANGRFLAVLWPPDDAPARLKITDLASGDLITAVRLEVGWNSFAGNALLWLPDSSAILVSGMRDTIPTAQIVSLLGVTDTLPLDGWQTVGFNRAGDHLALVSPNTWNVAIYSLQAGAIVAQASPEGTPLPGYRLQTAASWLDDERLAAAFAATGPDGQSGVRWIASVTPGGATTLAERDLPASHAAWSPDGQFLLLTTSGADGSVSTVLSLESGEMIDLAGVDNALDGANYEWVAKTTLLAVSDRTFWLVDPVADSRQPLLELDTHPSSYALNIHGCQAPSKVEP